MALLLSISVIFKILKILKKFEFTKIIIMEKIVLENSSIFKDPTLIECIRQI